MLAVLVLAVPLAFSPAHAGINTWTGIGPEGGTVRKVVLPQDASVPIYALAAGAGFFRSLDGGGHWLQSNDGIAPYAADFAVDPTNPGRVFLVIDQLPARVLISTDAGATFSTLYTFAENTGTPVGLAISADGNTVYGVNLTQLLQSTDRGQTWQLRTSLPAISNSFPEQLQVDPADASTLYVRYAFNLEVTHDGGGTWVDITPPNAAEVDGFAVDPSDSTRLWVAAASGLSLSNDRGVTWSIVNGQWTTSVALDPRSPATVYAGLFGGNILKGSGGTWTDISGNLGSFHPNFIAVSPRDSATLVVANERGLWTTANGGTSWALSDTGLLASFVTGLVPSSTRGRVYFDGSLIGELADGSDSVTLLNEDGLFAALHSQSSGVGALTPVSDSAGALIAALGTRIARSLDDGVTWSPLPYTTAASDNILQLAATTGSPSIYYANSQLTLQRSLDFGATWTPITTGLPAGDSAGLIAIAPSNPAILYAGPRSFLPGSEAGRGVYKSTNGGDSWVDVGLLGWEVETLAVDPTQPNIVYAGIGGGLMKTLDGGATWTALQWSADPFVDCGAVAIDAANPNVVYAASGTRSFTQEVARSADGGATWAHLASAVHPVAWQPTSLAIDPARPNTLRVGTEAAGIQEISLQQDLAIQVNPLAAALIAGVPVPFTVQVNNLGHLPSTGVGISIGLPAGSSAVSANASIGNCTVAASSIACTAPTLSGDSMTVTGTITPTAPGAFQLTASVQADQSDGDTSNNTASQSSSVSSHSDLGAVLGGTTQAGTGDSVSLSLTVTNAGPSSDSGVHAMFQAPSGIAIKSFTTATGSCSQTSPGLLGCDIASLSSGSTLEVDVTVSAATAGTYAFTGMVSGQGTDDSAGNNTSSLSLVVVSPAPPVVTTPSPPSGGGGGGGALSPLFLLGLLTFSLRCAVIRGALNPGH